MRQNEFDYALGVCHHCCRRIPRDHARKRAQGTTVLAAFDNPMPFSLQYAHGGRDDKLLPGVRDHCSLRCLQPLKYKNIVVLELSVTSPELHEGRNCRRG
jgi:hypothetical protein